MSTTYTPNTEEIEKLKEEISRLENEQSRLLSRQSENNVMHEEISKRITACYKKLNKLKEVKTVFDEFKTKSKEVNKRITKKALKFGLPATFLSWFIGGAILNCTAGAIIGVVLAAATTVMSSMISSNRKLKKDKEIMKNNNLKRIIRRIKEEEIQIENYQTYQGRIARENNEISRVYGQNQTKLEDLKLRLSILEPNPIPSTKKTHPYTKFKTTQP